MTHPSRPQVQRYDATAHSYTDSAAWPYFRCSDNGLWVKHDDHASSLAAKDAAIGELVEALTKAHSAMAALGWTTTQERRDLDALLAKHSATNNPEKEQSRG